MELANPDHEWEPEARRVFIKHADDPKYPKALTVSELLAQVDTMRSDDLTALAGQFGGGGKLSSQFKNYIRQCSCQCWPSWRHAWTDFAEFMGFGSLSHDIEDAVADAVQKRPLDQILRMFKEISDDEDRMADVLRREGWTSHEWRYGVARLVDAGRAIHENGKLVLRKEESVHA